MRSIKEMGAIKDLRAINTIKHSSYINTSLLIKITALELVIVLVMPLCIN